MFEQDYIMRQISQMIAFMMKALFGLKLEAERLTDFVYTSDGDGGEPLFQMVDQGQIEAAEQMLYDRIQARTADNLMLGYAFYEYLSQKDDDFLEAHGFSRERIAEGAVKLASHFGAGQIAELFLPEF